MRLPTCMLLLATLAGCGEKDPGEDDSGGGGDDGPDCTTEARASVQVSLEDADGQAIPDASLSWSTTDGESGDCEDITGSGDWVCGWEVAGLMTILAEAPGFEPGTAVVDVPAGECHVETVSTTITLEPMPCTEEEVAAVTLSVLAEDGGLLGDAVGYFVPTDEDWDAPGVCDHGLDGYMFCAWELSGDIDVWVEAPGYFTWWETISVDHDGCHPVTEHRDVSLVPQ